MLLYFVVSYYYARKPTKAWNQSCKRVTYEIFLKETDKKNHAINLSELILFLCLCILVNFLRLKIVYGIMKKMFNCFWLQAMCLKIPTQSLLVILMESFQSNLYWKEINRCKQRPKSTCKGFFLLLYVFVDQIKCCWAA